MSSETPDVRERLACSLFAEAEALAPCLHLRLLARVVRAPHAVDDGVRNLVDGRHQHRLYRLLLLGRQRPEASALALELLARDVAKLLLQGADGRADVEVAERLLELHHLRLDYQLGALGLALALAYVRGDDGFEVVHVEDEEGAELRDGRVDVARDAYVYEEGRAVAARPARALGHLGRDDELPRAGRADDYVRLSQMLFERVELDGLAAELDREPLRR